MSKTFTVSKLLRVSASSSCIIISNLFVIVASIVFQWELFPLLMLYWIENVILGLMTTIKLSTNASKEPMKHFQKVIFVPFFWVHYGMFTAIHGVFVFNAFGDFGSDAGLPSAPELGNMIVGYGLLWGVLSLTLGHVYSLAVNYFWKGEYREQLLGELMSAPYGRVIFLHVFILTAAGLIKVLHAPQMAVVLMAIMKAIGDLASHNAEHMKAALYSERRAKAESDINLQRQVTPSGTDSFVLEHPGYTRDYDTENTLGRVDDVGCAISLLILVGFVLTVIVAGDALSKPVARTILGAGLLVGLGSIVHGVIRRHVACPSCKRRMKIVKTECSAADVRELAERRYRHPSGRDLPCFTWQVCDDCKTYFLASSNIHITPTR